MENNNNIIITAATPTIPMSITPISIETENNQMNITTSTTQDYPITPMLISNEELASLNQQQNQHHSRQQEHQKQQQQQEQQQREQQQQHHHIGRGKKWQPEEDQLLSQAWLRVSSEDPLQNPGDQKVNDTFWNRVSEEFLRSCPGSNRPPRSIQQRWAKLHQSISQFGECYEEEEDRLPTGTSTEAITVEALKQYKAKTDHNFSHYSCWTLLRHTNQWIDHLNKPRMLPIKRKLNELTQDGNLIAVTSQTILNNVDQSLLHHPIDQVRPASDSGLCSSNDSGYSNLKDPTESNHYTNSSNQQPNSKTKETRLIPASSSTSNKTKRLELIERRIKVIDELNQSMMKKNQILEEFNRLQKETNQIRIMSECQSNESQLWFKIKQQEILSELNLEILQ